MYWVTFWHVSDCWQYLHLYLINPFPVRTESLLPWQAKNNLVGHTSKEARDLELSCSLNLMSCYLKTKQFSEAVALGTEVCPLGLLWTWNSAIRFLPCRSGCVFFSAIWCEVGKVLIISPYHHSLWVFFSNLVRIWKFRLDMWGLMHKLAWKVSILQWSVYSGNFRNCS